MTDKPEAKLWGGRFKGGIDPLMEAYNESIHYDRVLYAEDLDGSIAFARANVKTGRLTEEEFVQIMGGLLRIKVEWDTNNFRIAKGDEDIHTANERRLGEIIGTHIAGKLHTGRSRNEQIATDMRLWLVKRLRELEGHLAAFLQVIADRAETEISVVMPGYTHLQRAQPIRWAHWLLAYGSQFASDLERLREVRSRVNRSPLGFGALAGNPFGIDRAAMAKELGFEGLLPNSMAGVADRDFVVETMQWGMMLMTHMSRMAEDLIIYSTSEFGFVQLSDGYSTGSSLMPQKKNPDSLELLRGKAGRAFGHLAGLTMSVKGIPSTYNKDLQESLEPMFDHVKTVTDSILIATGVVNTLAINPERMRAALSPDMLATDLAEYLVRKGVPFRETHHISGRVVALAEEEGRPMDQLSLEELRSVDTRFGEDVHSVFDYTRSVEQRTSAGGTSEKAVREQIEMLRALIKSEGKVAAVKV
ncbi:argininosuccinate lyase [Trichodelitschia bisporula]|uniref:argininosuccinate lyase n=1 Tax=Trichodelitschia bisporula TaxID=703511 RepID=A0A6G1I4E7_9PEZI|nr:argininosuccinate lyase [Trichodelitschia bisporula]